MRVWLLLYGKIVIIIIIICVIVVIVIKVNEFNSRLITRKL